MLVALAILVVLIGIVGTIVPGLPGSVLVLDRSGVVGVA